MRVGRETRERLGEPPLLHFDTAGAERPPEGGPLFIREIMKAMEQLKLKPNDRRKIYFGNAASLLKLSLPKPAVARKRPAKKAKKKK